MRIAVTGAGGRVGSQVVRLLAGGSGHEIVALGRRDLHLPELPRRVSSVVADYSDPRALRAGLRGVDTLVFVSSDGPVAQMIVHHHNVIQAAMDSGVSHIVALSGLDSDVASPFCYAVGYGYTEQLLQEAGCGFLDRPSVDLQRILSRNPRPAPRRCPVARAGRERPYLAGQPRRHCELPRCTRCHPRHRRAPRSHRTRSARHGHDRGAGRSGVAHAGRIRRAQRR